MIFEPPLNPQKTRSLISKSEWQAQTVARQEWGWQSLARDQQLDDGSKKSAEAGAKSQQLVASSQHLHNVTFNTKKNIDYVNYVIT